MTFLIQEGVVIPCLRFGRFEIGGGIFPHKIATKFIIKNKAIDGLTDPLYPHDPHGSVYSSIGFKGFRMGVYLRYYHKGQYVET